MSSAGLLIPEAMQHAQLSSSLRQAQNLRETMLRGFLLPPAVSIGHCLWVVLSFVFLGPQISLSLSPALRRKEPDRNGS